MSPIAFAVCLLGLFFFVRPPAAPRSSAHRPDADSGELLAQMELLFPGQLNAVIDRDGVLQLNLTESVAAIGTGAPASPADQGLLVELIRGDHRLRVLAYSGRPVRLELDGVELRFDPLLTSAGDVVLSGHDFLWSSTHPTGSRLLAGWRIEARALVSVL